MSTEILAEPTQNVNHKKHSRVEVLAIAPVKYGAVRALARVKVGALVVDGCKVIAQEGQRAWCKLPDRQSKDGKWYPVVSCTSPTLEAAIFDAIMAAWRQMEVAADE